MNKNDKKPPKPIGLPPAAKVKRRYFTLAAALMLCLCCTVPALAAGDPLTVVNNLSEFIFSCIKAIGVIIL